MDSWKHSSGDLHSRLKTRKILGVGETDNGDIHRSKISQVLGHNEHLFIKFPRHFWMWYTALGSLFTLLGTMNVLFPETWFNFSVGVAGEFEPQLSFVTRLYGGTLLAFSCMMWSFWGTSDRAIVRAILLSTSVTFYIQIPVLMLRFWQIASTGRFCSVLYILAQSGIIAVNLYFYRSVGASTSGIRRSQSFKDLREHRTSDAAPPPSPKKFD